MISSMRLGLRKTRETESCGLTGIDCWMPAALSTSNVLWPYKTNFIAVCGMTTKPSWNATELANLQTSVPYQHVPQNNRAVAKSGGGSVNLADVVDVR